MTYDTVASISQVTSLLMFVAMFLAVLAYALWPANGSRFERAQRRALDIPEPPGRGGGNNVAGASLNSSVGRGRS